MIQRVEKADLVEDNGQWSELATRQSAGRDGEAQPASGQELPERAENSSAQPQPTVSVIVPVHSGGAAFRECLASIRAAYPAPDEVIVVADGNADGSAARAGELGIRVVSTARQKGPAAARNLGAQSAFGDILLFVDADVILPPSAIGAVKEFFGKHGQINAVIGSYDDAPAAPNFLSQYKNLLHHYVHQNAREEGYTFWGACGAIRRQVFLEMGGFDESYRYPSTEDIELGYRLKAAGHRIRLCKALQVKHLKRWRAGSLLATDFCRRALPWTRLILRSGRLENDLNIDWPSRVKVALVHNLCGLLALSCWWPAALQWAAVTAVVLLGLDAHLWRFLHQKRGALFALRAVPWHWFYYWYSGLAFALGLACHVCQPQRGRQAQPPIIAARPAPPAPPATLEIS